MHLEAGMVNREGSNRCDRPVLLGDLHRPEVPVNLAHLREPVDSIRHNYSTKAPFRSEVFR